MPDINFVRQRLRKLTQLEKQDQKKFKLVAAVALVLFLILAVILGFKLYLVSQLREIDASQKNYLARIQKQEAQEKSFVLFVNKLRVLSDIFSKRKDKQEAISYFSQVFGPDVTIQRIAYESDSELLSFRLMAADIFTLQQVFDLLSAQQATGKFASLVKSNLQRNDNGTYQMQVTVVLGDEEPNNAN